MERRICAGVIATVLGAILLFSGCSAQSAKEIVQKAQNEIVETALEVAVETVVDSAVTEYKEAAPVAESLQARVDVQVVSSQITTDGMTATCVVSAPDITDFIENIDINDYLINGEILDEEKLVNDVVAAIEKAPLTKQTVTVGLESTEDGYVPTDMEAFINAYTGGALNLLLEMQEEQAK